MNSNILKIRQALDLDNKILLTKHRIWQFYYKNYGNVYISFSGGKDSTVLLDLVRQDFPNVPAVFVDTGLEFPEIREFVKTIPNVIWLKPEMRFDKVLEKYGYPIVSKEVSQMIYEVKNSKSQKNINIRLYGNEKGKIGKIPEKWKFLLNTDFKISQKCCDIMKKRPFNKFKKMNGDCGIFVGTMTTDSRLRKMSYLRTGCNNFNKGSSKPLSFWSEEDIWNYIKKYNIAYSKIYDLGYKNTGCMFCMYGVHLEKRPNRFDIMKTTHPKQYKYCMKNLGIENILNVVLKRNNNVDLF